MKNKKTLGRREFYTGPDTPVVVNGVFMIKAKPARFPGRARFGVVSPKKILKLAVQRNRARRLLRDWIAFNAGNFSQDYDYIVIARNQILGCSRDKGRKLLRNAIRKIKKKISNAQPVQ